MARRLLRLPAMDLSPSTRIRAASLGVLLSLLGCEADPLAGLPGGTLEVHVVNASPETADLRVLVALGERVRDTGGSPTPPETVLLLEGVPPGTWRAEVSAYDARGDQLQAVQISDLLLRSQRTTVVRVDLGRAPPEPPLHCPAQGDLPLCARCEAGALLPLADDPRCGPLACGVLDHFELRGDNTAAGRSSCVLVRHPDREVDRCAGVGRCHEPSAERCPAMEEERAAAALCQVITRCPEGQPAVEVVPDGTPCGGADTCRRGVCTPPAPPPAGNGCADGTREGFLAEASYPRIAGCAGGWSIGGLTDGPGGLQCGRAAGNDGQNREGAGCAAADLCAAGWHVCRGKDEVAARSSTGCAGAVPPGTPDRALLFAVSQHSSNNSECDGSSGHNDVFGCGNLGNLLGPEKNCAPLDRALASTRADTCGFNEAEPNLGPWRCLGGPQSHLEEGRVVTKDGCPQRSCSYDGQPVGNADKGGVLCCAD